MPMHRRVGEQSRNADIEYGHRGRPERRGAENSEVVSSDDRRRGAGRPLRHEASGNRKRQAGRRARPRIEWMPALRRSRHRLCQVDDGVARL